MNKKIIKLTALLTAILVFVSNPASAYADYGDSIIWLGHDASVDPLPVKALDDTMEHNAIASILHTINSWNIPAEYEQVAELYFDLQDDFHFSSDDEEAVFTVLAYLLDISGAPLIPVINLIDWDGNIFSDTYLTQTNNNHVKKIVLTDSGWVNIIATSKKETKIMDPSTGSYIMVPNTVLFDAILEKDCKIITMVEKDVEYFDLHDENDVVYENKIIDFSNEAVIVNDYHYVPLKIIAGALGAELEFLDNDEIKAIRGKTEIYVTVGNDTCTMNGREVQLPAPIFHSESGNIMVPLRIITETFGIDITWIPESKTILLSYL